MFDSRHLSSRQFSIYFLFFIILFLFILDLPGYGEILGAVVAHPLAGPGLDLGSLLARLARYAGSGLDV
jgi:hypothetical protein